MGFEASPTTNGAVSPIHPEISIPKSWASRGGVPNWGFRWYPQVYPLMCPGHPQEGLVDVQRTCSKAGPAPIRNSNRSTMCVCVCVVSSDVAGCRFLGCLIGSSVRTSFSPSAIERTSHNKVMTIGNEPLLYRSSTDNPIRSKLMNQLHQFLFSRLHVGMIIVPL